MFPFKLAFSSYCCFSQKLPSPALMVCVVTSFCKFFFCFNIKKESSRGEEFQSIAASRVPGREDVLQRYYENSTSLLEKFRNRIFRLAISGHLLFKCYVR